MEWFQTGMQQQYLHHCSVRRHDFTLMASVGN